MGRDNFDCFAEKLKQYFVANAIPEDKQVATFLTTIGEPTYELLKSLVMSMASKDKSLTQLMSMLCAYGTYFTNLYSKRSKLWLSLCWH